MKTSRLTFLITLASCTAQHVVGEGTNKQAVTCGGIAQLPCSSTYVCVDNPADACDPANGGADCSGLCVQPQGMCGGLAGIACPSGETCVDDPRDACDPAHGGADCGGICVTYPSQAFDAGTCGTDTCSACAGTSHDSCSNGTWTCDCDTSTVDAGMSCGGLAFVPCPTGWVCVDKPNDGCDPATGGADCPGICAAPPSCGGLANIQCPNGSTCIDNPNDSCDPLHGGADCPGICFQTAACGADTCAACANGQVAADTCDNGTWSCVCNDPSWDGGLKTCAGFANFPCPTGYACIDEPDDCDPNDGGADCSGICVHAQADGGAEPGTGHFCGGIGAIQCASTDLSCVDNPTDGCDPATGGQDCGGFCI